jgi:site-specific DNA-cytosine methylase
VRDFDPFPQTMAEFAEPMIVDSFAGGGGASTGIELALNRSPNVAINHSEKALALHAARATSDCPCRAFLEIC